MRVLQDACFCARQGKPVYLEFCLCQQQRGRSGHEPRKKTTFAFDSFVSFVRVAGNGYLWVSVFVCPKPLFTFCTGRTRQDELLNIL